MFRLLQIVNTDDTVETAGNVRKAIAEFLNIIKDENIPFRQLNLPFEASQAIKQLTKLYNI